MTKPVQQFLRALQQRNASPNTILAYTKDLSSFVAYVGEVKPSAVDHVRIRGYLSELYDRRLGKTSVARHLAAVRSF
jgi:integrase/recombinase XerC